MSILDDAIREHLELKRAHGADETELKKLEDEAFGPPGRPEEEVDPFAEAPTQFLGAATEVAEAPPEAEGGRRMPNITDLQEPPAFPIEEATELPADEAAPEAPPAEEAEHRPEAEAPAAPEAPEAETPAPEPPAAEEHPAMEHEVPAPPQSEAEAATPAPELREEPAPPDAAPPEAAAAGPSTEEREIIADQPTQFFDVEAELQAGPPVAEPPTEQASPTDEELLDSQAGEPRLTPPSEELDVVDEAPSEEYEDDDFFSEQRLSDELNQALEAPVTDEHEALPDHEPLREPEPPAAAEPATPPPPPRVDEPTQIYDFEGDAADRGGDAEHEDEGEEDSEEHDVFEPDTGHDDVLEDTPQFLEESPDDDDLWFEQRPPKDFDFDD